MAKGPKPFNNPFAGVKLEEPAPKSEPKKPAAPPPARSSTSTGEGDESELFLAHVGEVAPVRARSEKAPIQKPPPPPRGNPAEEEALLQLSELVAGQGAFDLADSDAYIEGAVAGLDPQILRKLRRGDYGFQSQLDLHRLTREQAKTQLAVFIQAARLKAQRCVLVVHGRGLHSEDQLPVLKEGVQEWLSRGRLAKQVLAFTTAQPQDGGAGAIYVLLRS